MNTAIIVSQEAKGGRRMSMGMRNLKFWGRLWLECMGMSLGAAAVMIFLFGIGGSNFGAGEAWEMFQNELAVFPYYVMLCGTFVLLMVTISYIQLYCPLLVSMNVTRKAAIAGMLVKNVCLIAGITAVSGIVWLCLSGDVSSDGLRLMPLLAGTMFATGGLSLMLGVVVTKWGKLGILIFGLIGLGAGGFAGLLFAGANIFECLRKLDFNFYYALGIGIGVYGAASVFTVLCMRKMEVRA